MCRLATPFALKDSLFALLSRLEPNAEPVVPDIATVAANPELPRDLMIPGALTPLTVDYIIH